MTITIKKPEKINKKMKRIAVQLTLREKLTPKRTINIPQKESRTLWSWLSAMWKGEGGKWNS